MKKKILKCKQLVNAPYNKLNLDNYYKKISKLFKGKINLINNLPKNSPIKLMSNNHSNAGIITNINNKKLRKIRANPKSNISRKDARKAVRKIAKKPKRNIYIVGKGVLYDSGGYNLKGRGMNTMKCDMAGMATAVAVSNIVKNNVYFYSPVSANLLNNNFLPGDYLKIGNKIVEITNTDAEGRLILAEALTKLNVTKNDIVITVATLTGAVSYALGSKATAFMTPNKKLTHAYKKASAKAGELAWRLPLWSYLEKKYFNKKRIHNSIAQEHCGTITAGLFLKQFVKYPNNWIHLDIASSAFDEQKRKATGNPVKSIVNFVNNL